MEDSPDEAEQNGQDKHKRWQQPTEEGCGALVLHGGAGRAQRRRREQACVSTLYRYSLHPCPVLLKEVPFHNFTPRLA